MLGEVVEKIDDWQIERFQQSFQDDKISFTIQTNHSEKYSMLSGMRAHILRRNNSYQFIVTINSKITVALLIIPILIGAALFIYLII